MSLLSYFPEQFEQLKEFMLTDKQVVRCVRIDAEMKPMLNKALARMEDETGFPHAILYHTDPFDNLYTYFRSLYSMLEDQYRTHADFLQNSDISFSVPHAPPNTTHNAPWRFLLHAEALTEAFPDEVGSLVFILDPEKIVDHDGYQLAVAFLAEKIRSDWLKFIVFDDRSSPLVHLPPEKGRRIGYQTFYLSPEEIEKRIQQDLAAPSGLQPAQQRQYKGLLAGFAFARSEYAKAETYQRQWVAEAQKADQPSEVALALYNLGNTLNAQGAYQEATDLFCQSCDICIDNDLNALAPQVYTNLGISLHRQGLNQQAFDSLKVAQDMFKAQGILPGEAYVVDCLAQMYVDNGLYVQAEKTWRYCLSLYDGITSELFEDLRRVSRAAVIEKLERLYKLMGQPEKINTLKED